MNIISKIKKALSEPEDPKPDVYIIEIEYKIGDKMFDGLYGMQWSTTKDCFLLNMETAWRLMRQYYSQEQWIIIPDVDKTEATKCSINYAFERSKIVHISIKKQGVSKYEV